MKKIILITGFMVAMLFAAQAQQNCETGYCPETLRVEHKAGTVSPLTRVVTYKVVETTLSGDTACWITHNLGAIQQPTSATDATVASRGWFWQFNRKQGYAYDGSRTPSVVNWITSINENSNWLEENDPCFLLLGDNWRIPTTTEWTNVLITANDFTNAYGSVLKLNAAGRLDAIDGTFGLGGTNFYYQAQEQEDADRGRFAGGTSGLLIQDYSKAEAYPVRCIRTY